MAFLPRTFAPRFRVTALDAGVFAAAAVALCAGLIGLIAPLAGLALSAGSATALYAGRLIRLALKIHVRHEPMGPCRGAGFLGMGTVFAGSTVVALPLVPVEPRAWVACGGLLSAVAMFVLGLMLLPGAATTVADRLRRGLDGISIGVTLMFVFWLLLRPGAVPPLALVEGLATAAGLAVVTVVAVRAASYRRAALLCGAGAAITLAGLTGLAVPLAYGVSGPGYWPAPPGYWSVHR